MKIFPFISSLGHLSKAREQRKQAAPVRTYGFDDGFCYAAYIQCLFLANLYNFFWICISHRYLSHKILVKTPM